jgi:REP element-mobilizing transposase RayT
MIYSTGSHTKFYHRFHVVWTTKYRYKVMRGEMRERIREIIIQTCQVHIGPASDSIVKGDDADQGTRVL